MSAFSVQLVVTLTRAPIGWDWEVRLGESILQGWDAGSRVDAWRAASLVITGRLRQMPESPAEAQLAALATAFREISAAPTAIERLPRGNAAQNEPPGEGVGDTDGETLGRCISCGDPEPERCLCRVISSPPRRRD